MKKLSILLVLFIFSCKNYKPLTGQKLYLLNVDMEHVDEVEFDFLTNNVVQIKETMNVTPDAFITDGKMIKSSYSYSWGKLTIPQYITSIPINFQENGDYITDNNIIFYHSSILPILGSDEAKKRLMTKMANEKVFSRFMNSMHPKLGGFRSLGGGGYIFIYPRKDMAKSKAKVR